MSSWTASDDDGFPGMHSWCTGSCAFINLWRSRELWAGPARASIWTSKQRTTKSQISCLTTTAALSFALACPVLHCSPTRRPCAELAPYHQLALLKSHLRDLGMAYLPQSVERAKLLNMSLAHCARSRAIDDSEYSIPTPRSATRSATVQTRA